MTSITLRKRALHRKRMLARQYWALYLLLIVPVAYLLLSLLGIGGFCRRGGGVLDREAAPAGGTVMTMMLVLLAVVLGYQFLTRPVVYNGWRHVYFLYPVLVAFAVYGLCFLRKTCNAGKRRAFRWAAVCALIASMLFTGAAMVREHPYEYASYNAVGKRVALEFDRDYWKVSNTAALRELLSTEEGTLRVACLDGEYEPFLFGQQLLTQEEQARIRFDPAVENCDYLLVNCRYLLGVNDLPSTRAGFTEIASVWCGEIKLTSVQKRVAGQ